MRQHSSSGLGLACTGGGLMLPFFPDLLPDELLYSVLSRLRERLNVKSGVMSCWALGRVYIPSTDFPDHLSDLLQRLPVGHSYTLDQLVENHTLYPYYRPFFPHAQALALRDRMTASADRFSTSRIGGGAGNLRYCTKCIREDRERWGETYWHRVHQIPEVLVCPRHACFLCVSQVSASGPNRKYASAEEALAASSGTPIRSMYPDHGLHLHLAENAEWLLNHRVAGGGPEALYRAYLKRLRNRDLAFRRVFLDKLTSAFEAVYPQGLLSELGLTTNPSNGQPGWLRRFTANASMELQAPVKHLTMIHFLGATLEEIVGVDQPDAVDAPFGTGPWPCLNPVASHYMADVVHDCTVRFYGRMPLGTFRCECGFHYRRQGPDRLPSDRQRRDSIASFGPIFDGALCSLLDDPALSNVEIAERLQVDRKTVETRANNLGLSIRRPLRTSARNSKFVRAKTQALLDSPEWVRQFKELWLDPKVPATGVSSALSVGYRTVYRLAAALQLPIPKPKSVGSTVHTPDKVEQYRQSWLMALAQGLSRTDLYRKYRREYIWLAGNDREWLVVISGNSTRNSL